ncbi:MAG: hypothetical protein MUF51_06055, partial [Vicinamibacteria bacterium]|nr:hypothetical protein [Vicinamibacteria bacterium]
AGSDPHAYASSSDRLADTDSHACAVSNGSMIVCCSRLRRLEEWGTVTASAQIEVETQIR